MPKNKNQALRLSTIDQLIRNKQRRFKRLELLDELNRRLIEDGESPISERTFAGDIHYLKSDRSGHSAPIATHKTEGYYYYTDPDYSIFNTPIDQSDIALLTQASTLLKQLKGFGYSKELLVLTERLERKIQLKPSQELSSTISFEQTDLEGLAYLQSLHQYILDKQPLLVDYQPYTKATPSKQEFHPYFLKQYNQRWYVIGYCTSKEMLVNFALDRIKGIETAIMDYIPSSIPDFHKYFAPLIGVTRPVGEEPQDIQLQFDKYRAFYVRSKPLHPSQKEIKVNTFHYRLIINKELISKILEFGKDVEVLEPARLLEEVKAAKG